MICFALITILIKYKQNTNTNKFSIIWNVDYLFIVRYNDLNDQLLIEVF